MTNFYNEIDPVAAQTLRNLIAAGHIAPGVVDERSIEDITPDELQPYTQCHFFAGVGVWSLALRRAGWPDDRPVWTGSCPCQPFSAAGKGGGFADERHLWPSWHHLIRERKPPVIFGEQVASKIADPWIDLVQDDLEAVGYSVGAVPFPSAGVGAPHIRDRMYWVAHASGPRLQGLQLETVLAARGWQEGRAVEQCCGPSCRLANTNGPQSRLAGDPGSEAGTGVQPGAQCGGRCALGGVDHTVSERRDQRGNTDAKHDREQLDPASTSEATRPGPTNGLWRAADWLHCTDDKWRPVEPGTFPLAHGAPARVGRLRGYGNAINAEAARIFIETACVS